MFWSSSRRLLVFAQLFVSSACRLIHRALMVRNANSVPTTTSTAARPRCSRWWGVPAAPIVLGRGRVADRGLEVLLGLAVERGLDNVAAVLADARDDLVRRALAHEDHHGGAARLEVGAELLHEVVVDADVAEVPGRGAGGR